MSTYLQSYRVGTLSVANGSTSVTGTTTLWLANVLAGDLIIVGNTLAEVASVESNTALTLVSGWTGTTVTGSAYVIHRWSRGWLQAGTTALLLADYVSRIPTFIPTTGAPSDAVGSPGNIAVDTSANVFYVKGATTWGSAVSMVGTPGELTRSGAVSANALAAWVSNTQVKAATASEIRTAGGGLREVLTAARTYYLRTTGNDSNDGLTTGTAKLTPPGVMAAINALDLNGQSVTINVDGSFGNLNINRPLVGGTTINIVGSGTTTSRIGTSGVALAITAPVIVQPESIEFYGSTATISMSGGARININSGKTVRSTMTSPSTRHINVGVGCYFYCFSGTLELGGNSPRFMQVSEGAQSLIYTTTYRSTGAVAFSTAFIEVADAGVVTTNGNSTIDAAAGAITGKRYNVIANGVIKANANASLFPGDVAGTTATGGQYI